METKRPDGGWGWMIVLAGFIFNFFGDGSKYAFGIMFMELIDAFGRSKSETSWIISIQVATLQVSAPFTGALVNRFGCRFVAVVGTLTAFVGFVVSPFANSIYYLYVSYGFVAGLGFGMIAIPIVVSIARYFDRHLAFASGLSAMGSGMGMLLFGPLSKLLIDEYTWRGALLIQSAFLLNGLLCASVLRPIPAQTKCDLFVKEADSHMSLQDRKEHDDNEHIAELLVSSTKEGTKAIITDPYITCDKKSDLLETSTEQINEALLQEPYKLNSEQDSDTSKYAECVNGMQKEASDKQYDESCEIHVKGRATSEGTRNKRWFSFAPLKDPKFLLLLGSFSLVEISLLVPFTFLPDMMVQSGYTRKDSVFMLFLIGLLSTSARLVTGFGADLKFVNRVRMCYCVIILNGVLTVLCPFCFNYESYVAFAVVFGFASGSSAALRSVLIPDLFGIEMIADRLGIVQFCSGFAALIGLPITGAIYDVSGSYIIPFAVAGVELVISGSLVFFITVLKNASDKQHRP